MPAEALASGRARPPAPSTGSTFVANIAAQWSGSGAADRLMPQVRGIGFGLRTTISSPRELTRILAASLAVRDGQYPNCPVRLGLADRPRRLTGKRDVSWCAGVCVIQPCLSPGWRREQHKQAVAGDTQPLIVDRHSSPNLGHGATARSLDTIASAVGPYGSGMNAIKCRKYADSFFERAKLEFRGALKAHELAMAQAWLTLAVLYEGEAALLSPIPPQSPLE
jgi:hypothetical protein